MRAILLINPASGKEKTNKIIEVSKRKFQEKGYHLDIYLSSQAADLTDKAKLWAKDYDLFLVCGGDGTVNEVINGVMESEVRPSIAVIPSGTVNDISKIFGVPKNIEKNLDFILNSEPVETDINQINNQYFTYVSGAGYLTDISYMADREEKRKYGALAYLKTGIKGLKKKPYFKAKIESNGQSIVTDISLILVLSANQFGGLKLFRFSKKTKLNDGLVDIRIFTSRDIWLIFKLMVFVLSAGRKHYKETHISTNHAIITPLDSNILDWNADGERVPAGQIELTVIPKAIRFYVNPKRQKKLY